MEVKKLDCPSCGAPLEWNAQSCGFCKTEIRFFEENSAALPVNLTVNDIESNIVLHESDFWKETCKAVSAPYSRFKNFKKYNEQDFKNDFFANKSISEWLTMFYDTYFLLPGESFVLAEKLNDYGRAALLTSLRLIIIKDTSMFSIPWENFISWKFEKPLNGKVIYLDGLEYVEQPVLRYTHGEKERIIRSQPDELYILEDITTSIISCREWLDLTPFQRNLLTTTRYNINRSYKIEVRPLELMQLQKKGCFVATATMGDYNHPSVLILQEYRDTYLINKTWGRIFIKWYYENGPQLAMLVEGSMILKKICHWLIIKPLVLLTRIVRY